MSKRPILAILICSSLALAKKPAPAAGPPPTVGAPGTELAKLNLTRPDYKKALDALWKALSPPGAGSDQPYDTGTVSNILARLISDPPFRDVANTPAWGGAEGNTVSTYLDLGNPSELLRVARVYRCLPRGNDGKLILNPDDGKTAAVFAVCHADMQKLDKATFEKDLLADARFNDFGKAIARDRFAVVKADSEALLAAFQAKAAKDPDFKAQIFDEPDKAAADWEAGYAAHKQEIDDARALIHKILADVPGRGKVDNVGCGEPTHKALSGYVQSTKAATPADVIKAATDDVGYTLLVAALLCDAKEGRYGDAYVEAWLIRRAGERLGPRSAVGRAVIAAVQQRAEDKKPTPFKIGDLKASPDEFTHAQEFWNGKVGGADKDSTLMIDSNIAGGAKDKVFDRAVLASTKKANGGVELTFKTESWTQPDFDCVKTRIINWERDGTPIWEYSCKPAGSHIEKNTHDPVTVNEWAAASLKPGQLIQSYSVARSSDRIWTGTPIAVWSDKKRTRLVMAYGIPVAGGSAAAAPAKGKAKKK